MKPNIYSPEFTRVLFNQMSSSYERVNYISSFGFSIRWRRQLLKPLRLSDEEVEVIDLMTGMGETWKAIKTSVTRANVTA